MSLSIGTTTIQRTNASVIQIQGARRSTGFGVTFLALLSFMGLGLLLLSAPDNPEIIFTLGVSLIFAICIIRWPVTGTFMAVVMATLFDTLPSTYVQTFFSELGVFRNLSYRGLPEGVLVSLFELVIVVSMISALVHRFHERKKLERGPLFWPMLSFGIVILVGEVTGLLSGGDFKISLWEIRPLMYLVLLYVLAVNTVNKPSHIRALLWLTVTCVAIRCAEGIWRYFQIPADTRVTVPTVLEHDDSLFLVIPFALLLAAVMWRRWLPKYLLPWLVALIPVALYVIIINHRRAAFLCIFLIIATCLPLMWVSLRSKQQRRRFVYITITAAILGALYLAAFWNSSNSLAEPARAVRSMVQPDDRDYSSNLYRDVENANLRFTISFSPITGMGFGKPMLLNTPMIDIRDVWAFQLYMPHNNVLWLWMRMGIIGFGIFWIAIGVSVLLVATCVRLGVTRMRMLAAEEQDLIGALSAGISTPSTNRSLQGMTIARLRVGTRGSTRNRSQTDRQAIATTQKLLHAKQADMRECAEFLTLNLLAMAIVASLVAITIVDQGLMSFRLTTYTGLLLGTLAAAWSMYSVKFRLPQDVSLGELPERNEWLLTPETHRRVRLLPGMG